MTRPAPNALKRLCIQLCMLLAFVFAGTSATTALDRVQHAPGASVHHVHGSMSLATMLIEDGHGADHHDGAHPDGDEHGSDSHPGHHHHADGSPGLPSLAAVDTGRLRAEPAALTAPPAPLLLGVTLHGPERPPKAGTRAA